MRFLAPLAITSLLGSSALASAQQAPTQQAPAPASRFYVGLAAYTSNYLPIGRAWQKGFLLPLQATVGYQLMPRLALQGSFAYSSRGNSYAGTSYDLTSTGQVLVPYSYAGQYRQRLSSAALLARYTLTRQAASRWQFDLLGGLTLVHTSYEDSYERTAGSSAARADQTSYRTNSLLPTAGLGVRYRLLPKLEATSNVLLGLPVAGYGTRELSPSLSLGLQYTFGGH